MTNKQRRAIVDEAKSKGYTGSYIDLFKQAMLNPSENEEVLMAGTEQEKKDGLRPYHEAGRTDASMSFPDVPPNTPFNTVGMKAPIDIKKYDEQGHLVKSYENVPPGLTNIDSGPARGMVLETPARMQGGGPVKEQAGPRVPIQDEPIRSTESMNLDNDSTYNTRGWLAAGAPGGIDPGDGEFHGASVDPNTGMWLKSKEHSTAWKEHLGAQLSPDPFFKKNMAVVNPEGYFGENQLQYVPRKKQQVGGYNPGEYMNEMQPKVFPNQKRDAQWVNYTTEHDFAGRFPGETKSNRELGLEISNRNTVPLPPTPTVPKELRTKAQEGATVEPEAEPQEEQSWGDYLGFNNPLVVTNFVNPFSNLFVPRVATNEIKTRITDNIQPHGYEKGDKGPLDRLYSAVVDDEAERYSNRDMQERGKGRSRTFQERTDLFKMMLGQDQVHNTIEVSEYKPTKGDPNTTYYKSKATEDYIRRQIKSGRNPEDIVGVRYHSDPMKVNVLGNYTIDHGEDEKGKYISYYDRWDLNPISDGEKGPAYYAEEAAKALLGLKGPEVYGRVYYNYGGYRSMKRGGFKGLKDRRGNTSGI